MADEEKSPSELAAEFRTRAQEMFPDDPEEANDWVELKMKKAGFNKGPGEWITEEDDPTPADDDDEPMKRGEFRAWQREQRKRRNSQPANRITPKQEEKPKKKDTQSTWWKDYD